jgi:hypothetical protein
LPVFVAAGVVLVVELAAPAPGAGVLAALLAAGMLDASAAGAAAPALDEGLAGADEVPLESDVADLLESTGATFSHPAAARARAARTEMRAALRKTRSSVGAALVRSARRASGPRASRAARAILTSAPV